MEQLYRDTFLAIVKKNIAILNHIFHELPEADAKHWRDGAEGWTSLEVLCHIADYDEIFYNRVILMLEQDNPPLPGYDHEALAIERHYNEQSLASVLERLNASRERFIALFASLTEEQFVRTGIHPEYGTWWVERSLSQLAYHDSNHIEQITRIIRNKE
jgi:uncharacterized damage-inducible protein DinB